jgi:hypothetical protein
MKRADIGGDEANLQHADADDQRESAQRDGSMISATTPRSRGF